MRCYFAIITSGAAQAPSKMTLTFDT